MYDNDNLKLSAQRLTTQNKRHCMYTKTNYKGVLKLRAIHRHGVLIFKKGSMEVDSSIEARGLTLQRGATFSINEEASSFSHEHFLDNHAY